MRKKQILQYKYHNSTRNMWFFKDKFHKTFIVRTSYHCNEGIAIFFFELEQCWPRNDDIPLLSHMTTIIAFFPWLWFGRTCNLNITLKLLGLTCYLSYIELLHKWPKKRKKKGLYYLSLQKENPPWAKMDIKTSCTCPLRK